MKINFTLNEKEEFLKCLGYNKFSIDCLVTNFNDNWGTIDYDKCSINIYTKCKSIEEFNEINNNIEITHEYQINHYRLDSIFIKELKNKILKK